MVIPCSCLARNFEILSPMALCRSMALSVVKALAQGATQTSDQEL